MRSGTIAVIGGIVTFVAVVSISLWKSGEPVAAAAAQPSAPVESLISAPASSSIPAPASAGAARVAQITAEPAPAAEPPEDARAMMDAAMASPDADVRDEASALSQAMNAESSPGE
jgi:hypothetical protein